MTLNDNERTDELGWLILGESSLKEPWNNQKEDKIWKKYLRSKKI